MSNINKTSLSTRIATYFKEGTKSLKEKVSNLKLSWHSKKESINEFKNKQVPQHQIQEREVTSNPKSLEYSLSNVVRDKGKQTPQPEMVKVSSRYLGKIDLHPNIFPNSPLGKNLGVVAGMKIDAGFELYQKLINPNKSDPLLSPTKEDVSNLMWFLKAKAELKASSHEEGAMTVEDPGGKIRDYLDGCKEMYQRMSSHIKNFQTKDNVHRGIDFHHGNVKTNQQANEMLPYGMGALLYGSMPNGKNGMPKDMLYLKMEPHGAAAFKPSTGYQTGLGSRKLNRHDIGQALGHSFGFIRSLYQKLTGKTTLGNARKEHIPSDIKKSFDTLVKSMPEGPHYWLSNNTLGGYLLGDERTGFSKDGIRNMYTKANDLLNMFNDNQIKLDDKTATNLKNFIKKIDDNPNFDNLDVRTGNEVIFTKDELSSKN